MNATHAAFGLCPMIRSARAPEKVMVKTHWPFANFIDRADEGFAKAGTIGGVIKTVRDPRVTYSDCKRKKYANAEKKTFEWFEQKQRRHHEYWDAFRAHGVDVVNIPFEELRSGENVTQWLMQLRAVFFPEITPERARLAVTLYPPRDSHHIDTAPSPTRAHPVLRARFDSFSSSHKPD